MTQSRFVTAETLTPDGAVEKVWDNAYERHRVRRRLWNLPRSEWEDARERFRDLAQLSQRALPSLVAVGEEERTLCLVEDHIDGETLQALLDRDEPPSESDVARMMIPVVGALGAMHELFMGHGAIDTRSVVVDADGQAYLVGAGAREALPDSDFDALSEVLVRAFHEPTEDSGALVQDLRTGKLRDCAKVAARLRELLSEEALEEQAGIEEAFGLGGEPLEASVEELSESEEDDFDFGWPAGDELDFQRRADDRRMLRWFAIGTGAIATIGLVAAIDLGGSREEVVAPLEPEGPIEFASIEGDPLDDAPEEPVRRVDGLGKWLIRREDGARHPTTVATIQAENSVRDRLNRSGTPTLHVRCADEKLSLSVDPGVDTVEAFVAKDATYAKHADLGFTWEGFPTEHIRADFRPEASQLDLRTPLALLAGAPRSESLYLSYVPFASESVIAIFDVRGMDRALAALGRFCGLPPTGPDTTASTN